MAAVLGGCGAKETDTVAAEETPAVSAETEISSHEAKEDTGEDAETLGAEKTAETGTPEGMTLYAELPFFFGETQWRLQKFAQAGLAENGELLLDDSCRFLIRAVSEDGAYIFFDETVQLGQPEADVWTDSEDRLHVVVRDARTARYRIADYVYDEAAGRFSGRILISEDGINYWGTAAGNNGAPSDAAGVQEEAEILCGYIQKVEDGTVWIDWVEYVEEGDTDRIQELGLSASDMAGGFYIYNPEEREDPLSLDDHTVYAFIDWGRDFIFSDSPQDLTVSTTTLALFKAYLATYEDGRPGMPFFLEMTDGTVRHIFEKPMA